MSLAVALPTAIAGAVAYGGSTAVQHLAAHDEAAGGLLSLLRNPRWWLSIGGDSVGLLLQLIALATGPVVLVQPLFILSLPVALPIRRRLGGPRVTGADYAACGVLGAGLAAFFVLAGDPGAGREMSSRVSLWLVAATLVSGSGLVALSRSASATIRALMASSVAGIYFGVEAVLINAAAAEWSRDGWSAFAHHRGLIALGGAVAIGLIGFFLAQVAFHAGSLGASFPAMLVLDPLTAVVLGAMLLGEQIGLTSFRGLGYLASFALITAATLRLARITAAPSPAAANQNAVS